MIDKIINSSPKSISLIEHSKLLTATAESLLAQHNTLAEINNIKRELIKKNDESLIFILLALKIAKSKIFINRIKRPLSISVVFAVYKEHNRIRKISEHPHGEDFLNIKMEQLKWLFADNKNIDWQLIVVDDGCPENSGKIAQSIIDKNNFADKAQVLYLKDAIKQKLPPVQGLKSVDDSKKGGAIAYGMWHSVQQNSSKRHIVIYTDADLSTHLGQIGLLANPILNQGKLAVTGSRRSWNSIVIKKENRNKRGKLFIYLWKRLLPCLHNIVDTQCGFKGFRANIISDLTKDLIERQFAFDIELLLKTNLIKHNGVDKTGIAWIDSEEESTTKELQSYLPMLKAIVKMYKKYCIKNPNSDEFAAFVESLTDEEFNNILANVPKPILKKKPFKFTKYDKVKVADLVKHKN